MPVPEYELHLFLLHQEVKRQLGLESKCFNFYVDEQIVGLSKEHNFRNKGYILTNIIPHPCDNKGFKKWKKKEEQKRSLIDETCSGFSCEVPDTCLNYQSDSILLLENYKKVKLDYIRPNYFGLHFSVLVEFRSIMFKGGDFNPIYTEPKISICKKIIFEGPEYKTYLVFTVSVKLPIVQSDVEKREEILRNYKWLNYISEVFKECIEGQIKEI